jgi:hypothetical protein
MTGALQRKMVEAQARQTIDRGSICPACQQRLRRKQQLRSWPLKLSDLSL